jgi:hypothetical protein
MTRFWRGAADEWGYPGIAAPEALASKRFRRYCPCRPLLCGDQAP